MRIAIFASGTGTNTKKIIEHFRNSASIVVGVVVCNNPLAGVLQIAATERIPVILLEKKRFSISGYLNEIKEYAIDFIVLAGFLWKIPEVLIKKFPETIINIHPALLPAYGGKGMYGIAVHKAVIDAGEKQSGITIHYVDEKYDHGKIIFQATCTVDDNETPESLAQKIHILEHKYYPLEIEKIAGIIK